MARKEKNVRLSAAWRNISLQQQGVAAGDRKRCEMRSSCKKKNEKKNEIKIKMNKSKKETNKIGNGSAQSARVRGRGRVQVQQQQLEQLEQLEQHHHCRFAGCHKTLQVCRGTVHKQNVRKVTRVAAVATVYSSSCCCHKKIGCSFSAPAPAPAPAPATVPHTAYA